MSRYRSIIGSNETVPVQINISDEIKNGIKAFSTSDTSRELGGVLVGKVFENDANNWTVIVENYIIAQHTNAHLSSVTFTAETWAQINNEMDTTYPDSKIVGWFHTHPGFGIFLSNMDIFIQDNFFNIPWQIAYVVDPCHKTDGFFVWKAGEIIKISEDSFRDIPKVPETQNIESPEEAVTEALPADISNENVSKGDISDVSLHEPTMFQKLENNPINRIMGKFSQVISFILIVLFLGLIVLIGYKYLIKNDSSSETVTNKIQSIRDFITGNTIKKNIEE
ncbi:MAG: Mov34/MPN/PAD-1 family protein [Abditibacteriota bacterium]|nr:Mov34/MPN/PAD-1 family protein [Abditibacteriota bacterium]